MKRRKKTIRPRRYFSIATFGPVASSRRCIRDILNNWSSISLHSIGFPPFFSSHFFGFTEFYGFHWVLLGLTGFYWVLLGFTGLYWVLLGFNWVLLGFYRVLPGFTGFSCFFLPAFIRRLHFQGFYYDL